MGLRKRCRKIRTIVICGSGAGQFQREITVTTNYEVSAVLGCWAVDHAYTGSISGDEVSISGVYTLYVWYSYDEYTKTEVVSQQVHYIEKVPLDYWDPECSSTSFPVKASVIVQPDCTESEFSGNKIQVSVDYKYDVELSEKDTLCVYVCDDCQEGRT
ncbi:outer spore coat protein CotE [Bacillus dakarensis]|uniref:outer spore coat protein CotE n=1 Tax=Robertmurraya dakarensis TaxID=1926278 RepID=UPI0009824D78|nr:outer spore coat protein CotE [Bacillus dakarensis]